jgi:hypothetical protein
VSLGVTLRINEAREDSVANRLSKVRTDEVSLVPRPANQHSHIRLAKNDPTPDDVHVPVPLGGGKKKRKVAGAKGEPMPHEIDKSALSPEVAEYVTKLEDTVLEQQDRLEKGGLEGDEPDTGVEALLKSADPALVEYVQSIEKSAADAQAIAKAEREAREDREALAKAESLGHLGEARGVADLLKSAQAHMPEADFRALDELLTKANGQIESGALFAELGKGGREANLGGSERIEKAAQAVLEKDPSLTKEQAVDKAMQADPSLYADYEKERG